MENWNFLIESDEKMNLNKEAEAEACAEQPKKTVRVQPEEIFHKSSKELYRAVAKQWGITCKVIFFLLFLLYFTFIFLTSGF